MSETKSEDIAKTDVANDDCSTAKMKVEDPKTEGTNHTDTPTTVRTEESSSPISDDSDEDPQAQQHSFLGGNQILSQALSQGDEEVRQLDNEGALNEVAGSQSILSQELFCCSQRTADDASQGYDMDQSPLVAVSRRLLLSQESAGAGMVSQGSIKVGALMSQDSAMGFMSQGSRIAQLESYNISDSQTESQLRRRIEGEFVCSQTSLPPVKSDPDASLSPSNENTDTPKMPVAIASDANAALSPPRRRLTRSASRTSNGPALDNSQGFDSLLDAVQVITEREEFNSKLHDLVHHPDKPVSEVFDGSKAAGMLEFKSNSPSNKKDGGAATTTKKRKAEADGSDVAEASKKPRAKAALSARKKKQTEATKAQKIAQRAAALAEQTAKDPDMAKKLLLSMALVRVNPRTAPSVWPAVGSVIPEGFFWAHYPPLEGVLKEHMAEYYELSTTKCQSAQQQTFNNDLVIFVREKAAKQGWKFDSSFSDKVLRDRIRCYYKTHIQNAKKRLRTMVRNPTKRANARHLCAHLDLIEKHKSDADAAMELELELEKRVDTINKDASKNDTKDIQKDAVAVVKKDDAKDGKDVNKGNEVNKAEIEAKGKPAKESEESNPKQKAVVKEVKEVKKEDRASGEPVQEEAEELQSSALASITALRRRTMRPSKVASV